MISNFEMVAKTFKGLENVLADELRQLGAENVEPGNRMVSFTGDLAMLYRANIGCRTALRILKPIYKFYAQDADELYNAVKDFAWDEYLSSSQTFSIDATVFSEKFRHSRFVTYRVKDAIADYFTEKYGKRPSIRLNNPDLVFDVHISDNEVTLSLDSSGESLHKRGYREAQTEAPINEVLAAGIILLTGWRGETDFVDPMCGSGTFLIEAALIAANINPGIFRSSFAFERWPDFDQELFDEIYNDDSKERPFEHKIYGSDISPKAIDIALRNIKSAAVGKYVEVKAQPLQSIEHAPHEGSGGILFTNPPYGERISVDDMEALYRSLGEKLKNVFKGYKAWVIGYNTDLLDAIGLKPSLKFPLFNGALDCELREYVIFEGTYAEFRKEGRSVKNEEFKGERNPVYKRRDFVPTVDANSEERKPRYNKWRREDDGERKERRDDDRRGRQPRFRTEGKPKNALEEKLRKPYHERRKDEEDRRRFKSPGGERMTHDGQDEQQRQPVVHNEARTSRMVRFKQPRLAADKEQPIIHGRRNSWRRNDLPVKEKGGDDNNNE